MTKRKGHENRGPSLRSIKRVIVVFGVLFALLVSCYAQHRRGPPVFVTNDGAGYSQACVDPTPFVFHDRGWGTPPPLLLTIVERTPAPFVWGDRRKESTQHMPDTYIVTPMSAYYLDNERQLCFAPVNQDETVDWTPEHGGPVDIQAADSDEELAFIRQLPFALMALEEAVSTVLEASAGL